MAAASKLRLAFWITLFLLSGLASPIIVTRLNFVYHPEFYLLWPLYPLYVGNLLVGTCSPSLSKAQWVLASKLFVLDASAQALSNVGLLEVGPPLYAIFYKAVTIFTGCMSLCFLPPASHPSRMQWAAICLITFGLGLTGMDAFETLGMEKLLGCLLVTGGCLFYAAGAVFSEMYLAVHEDSLEPLQVAWVFGVEGIIFCIVWALCTMREMPFGMHGILLLLALVAANAGHQASWFTLVGQLGACPTAVLKAFMSVSIFFTASAFFCRNDPAECIDKEKLISFFVVSVGVLIYSYPWPHPTDSSIECDSSVSLQREVLPPGPVPSEPATEPRFHELGRKD